MMSLFKTGFIGTFLLLSLVSLSACSNNKTASTNNGALQNSEKQGGWQNKDTLNKASSNKASGNNPISNMLKVETGKIVTIKTIAIQPEKIDSYGNIGVSVGSGGHSGIYGAFDIATLGKVFRNANKPKTAQQFIIRKSNGEMVAITQPSSEETFKTGESIKMLLQNGKAKVSH